MYPHYMYILLYVKVILCNGIPYIYCHLEGIMVSQLDICQSVVDTQ